MLLSGPPVAQAIYHQLHQTLAQLAYTPQLRVLRLGDDPASVSYVRLKDRQARALGLRSQVSVLPAEATHQQVLQAIQAFNADPEVDGILLQAPLPAHLSFAALLEAIDPHKDVDGLTPFNTGRLWMGNSALEPCTPAGIMALLEHYGIEVAGRRVVIVNRSNLVGKPLAAMMLRRDATVTLAHSRTPQLAQLTAAADLLVTAVGRSGFIEPHMVKPGAVVVDVSVNRTGQTANGRDRLVGDCRPEVAQLASAITPVPGGVGPMTVAMLLANTVKAAQLRRA